MPFNWRMPFGYLIAFTFVYVSAFVTFYAIVPTFCFAIGTCMLTNAFLKDTVNDVNTLNVLTKAKDRKRIEMKQLFFEIVQNFSDLKE